MNNKKNVNIEILRIIAMIMIVILHFLLHGKILENLYSDRFILNFTYFFLESVSIVAVNIYVFITGYFMCEKNINYGKIKKIAAWVWFYSIAIGIILVSTKVIDINLKNIIQILFPILTNQYWFVTAYILLMLLSPYINKIIKNIDKKDYKKLLILLFVCNSIVFIINNKTLLLNTANSTTWFINLYLISGYCKKYNVYYSSKKTLFTYLLLAIINAVCAVIAYAIFGLDKTMYLFKYNMPIVLIESLSLFIFFINKPEIKIKEQVKKIILFLSESSLAVYLISDNNFIRDIFWRIVIKITKFENMPLYIKEIYIIIIAILIYFICTSVDQIYQQTLKNIKKKEEKNNLKSLY